MAAGWLMVVGIAAVIGWAVAMLASGRSADRPAPDGPSALEMLERRYAGGEVTDAQFDAMRRRLQPPGSP
jgi:uncharacterized membrane protein